MQNFRWMISFSFVLLSLNALAQVKPKVMIILDTSGSMLRSNIVGTYGGPCRESDDGSGNITYECDPGLATYVAPYGPAVCDCRSADLSLGDDGSEICPGEGSSTRVFQLKQAMFEVLQGPGIGDMDWALATFPQALDPTRTPLCPKDCTSLNPPISPCAGHYFTDPASAGGNNGNYWGCKVSTHDPETQTSANCINPQDPGDPCYPWYDAFTKEVLRVPFGAPVEDLSLYFDHQEDAGSLPAGTPLTNPEVRAAFSWYTPLGMSLFYAHGYFSNGNLLPPNDPMKACERPTVILLTDGAETCNNVIADPFYPTTWSKNLTALGVTTHVVGIDTNTTTDDLLRQIATEGGGVYRVVPGNTALIKQAVQDALVASAFPTEACNGLDDDCDGETDEDFPSLGLVCDNGLPGACQRSGHYVCMSDGTGMECDAPSASGGDEVCNGLDDDCDGEIDEEVPGGCPDSGPGVDASIPDVGVADVSLSDATFLDTAAFDLFHGDALPSVDTSPHHDLGWWDSRVDDARPDQRVTDQSLTDSTRPSDHGQRGDSTGNSGQEDGCSCSSMGSASSSRLWVLLLLAWVRRRATA